MNTPPSPARLALGELVDGSGRDLVVPEAIRDSVFDGPVGVSGGVAREIGGRIKVTSRNGLYEVSSTRIPNVLTRDLHTVIIGSGEADLKIDDGVSDHQSLSVHMNSGTTNLVCGDRTVVAIGQHSGFNDLKGFVAIGVSGTQNGESYTLAIPEGRQAEVDTGWVTTMIKVSQASGFINVANNAPKPLDASSITSIEGLGQSALQAPAE